MRQCKACGADTFMAVIKKGAAVRFEDDGTAIVLKEAGKFEIDSSNPIVCGKCKTIHDTIDDLVIPKVKCVDCGTEMDPGTDINGRCELCDMKERLKGKSQDELLLELIRLQKELKAVQGTRIEAKVEKAEETVKELNEKAEEKQVQAAEEVKEDKPKAPARRKSVKKKEPKEKETPVVEEAPQEVTAEEPVEEAKEEVEAVEAPATEEASNPLDGDKTLEDIIPEESSFPEQDEDDLFF